jgi:hypothetical protein
MLVTTSRSWSMRVAVALAAAVAFGAACGGGPTEPIGSKSRLQVNVVTIGVDYDTDGYLLRIDIEQAVASRPSVTVYRWLSPGSYDVQLDALAGNCALAGPAVVPVTIVPEQSRPSRSPWSAVPPPGKSRC